MEDPQVPSKQPTRRPPPPPLGSKRRTQLDANMRRWRAAARKLAMLSGTGARSYVDIVMVRHGDAEQAVPLPVGADLEWITHEVINQMGIKRRARRILLETTTEVVWEQDVVQLHYLRPFADARLVGPRLYNKPGEFALQLPPYVGPEESLTMNSDDIFCETVEELPWTVTFMFDTVMVYLRELLLAGDPSAVHDGAHGMWEMSFLSVPEEKLDIPTTTMGALVDVLELKERKWPSLEDRKDDMTKENQTSKHEKVKKDVARPASTQQAIEGVSENAGLRSALFRNLRHKMGIAERPDARASASKLLSGLLSSGKEANEEISTVWRATVTNALHAVWALAARSERRKQLIDMGAHKMILQILHGLVAENERHAQEISAEKLADERDQLITNGVPKGSPKEQQLKLEAGCIGALALLLIDPNARKDLEETYGIQGRMPGTDADKTDAAPRDAALVAAAETPKEEGEGKEQTVPNALKSRRAKSTYGRLERIRQMGESERQSLGWSLLARLSLSTFGHLEGYPHDNCVAAAQCIVNALARGTRERRIFLEAGGVGFLREMMTVPKEEVQKCAMVGLSMYADAVGMRKYLELKDLTVMGREARPVLRLSQLNLNRRICMLTKLRRQGGWCDRILSKLLKVDLQREQLMLNTIPFWHAVRAALMSGAYDSADVGGLLALLTPCALRPASVGRETLLILCHMLVHVAAAPTTAPLLIQHNVLSFLTLPLIDDKVDGEVRCSLMTTLMVLTQAALPSVEAAANPVTDEATQQNGAVVHRPLETHHDRCVSLKEAGLCEVVMQAMAKMHNLCIQADEGVHQEVGFSKERHLEFRELSLAVMMCTALVEHGPAKRHTLEHAVYSVCTTYGKRRELAACNLYLLARNTANRKVLGELGAIEAVVTLLHESMRGAMATRFPEAARIDFSPGETCMEPLAPKDVKNDPRIQAWLEADSMEATLIVTAEEAAACFGESTNEDPMLMQPPLPSPPSHVPMGSVKSECISQVFEEQNTARLGDEWMAAALWVLLAEPANHACLMAPGAAPAETLDAFGDPGDPVHSSLLRLLLQLLGWQQLDTVVSPSLHNLMYFVIGALHTAIEGSPAVFDAAVYLRAPARLMARIQAKHTFPRNAAACIRLLTLLLSRPLNQYSLITFLNTQKTLMVTTTEPTSISAERLSSVAATSSASTDNSRKSREVNELRNKVQSEAPKELAAASNLVHTDANADMSQDQGAQNEDSPHPKPVEMCQGVSTAASFPPFKRGVMHVKSLLQMTQKFRGVTPAPGECHTWLSDDEGDCSPSKQRHPPGTILAVSSGAGLERVSPRDQSSGEVTDKHSSFASGDTNQPQLLKPGQPEVPRCPAAVPAPRRRPVSNKKPLHDLTETKLQQLLSFRNFLTLQDEAANSHLRTKLIRGVDKIQEELQANDAQIQVSINLLYNGHVESLSIWCMGHPERALRLTACRATAMLALDPKRKVLLEREGAVEVLTAVATECCEPPNVKGVRPWSTQGASSQGEQDLELLQVVLTALLNLTSIARNQQTVCRLALPLLMHLMGLEGPLDTAGVGATVRGVARATLQNLMQNRENVTELYKMELRWKAQLASTCGAPTWLAEETGSLKSPPHSARSPAQRLFVRTDSTPSKPTLSRSLSAFDGDRRDEPLTLQSPLHDGLTPRGTPRRPKPPQKGQAGEQRRQFQEWLSQAGLETPRSRSPSPTKEDASMRSLAASPRKAKTPRSITTAAPVASSMAKGWAMDRPKWSEDVCHAKAGQKLFETLRSPMSAMWRSLCEEQETATTASATPRSSRPGTARSNRSQPCMLSPAASRPGTARASVAPPPARDAIPAPPAAAISNSAAASTATPEPPIAPQAPRTTKGGGTPRRGARLTSAPVTPSSSRPSTARAPSRPSSCRSAARSIATTDMGSVAASNMWRPPIHTVSATPREAVSLRKPKGRRGSRPFSAVAATERGMSGLMADVALAQSRPATARPMGVPALGIGPAAAKPKPDPPPTAPAPPASARPASSSNATKTSSLEVERSWYLTSKKKKKPYPDPPADIPLLKHLLLPARPPKRKLKPPAPKRKKAAPKGVQPEDVEAVVRHVVIPHPQPCACKECTMRAYEARSGATVTTVQLDPPIKRNVFHFVEGHLPLFRGAHALDLFAHVDGCRHCADLYDHFPLQDGRLVHYYHPPDYHQDDIALALEGAPPPPLTLELTGLSLPSLPESAAAHLRTSPVQVIHYRPVPNMPPRPQTHWLDVVDHPCPSTVGSNHASQCAFHGSLRPPVHRFRVETSTERRMTIKDRVQQPWDIDRSVFAPRKREAGGAFYDTQRLLTRMFETDFERMAIKSSFRRDVVKGLKGTEALKTTMQGLYSTMLHCFDYYCAGDGNYNMGLGEFLDLCSSCQITDRVHCKVSDLTTIFNQANEEDEAGSDDDDDEAFTLNDLNDDSALHRFEFMEALCRIAKQKFKPQVEKERWPTHVCLENLVVDIIEANVPLEAMVIPNTFRQLRLYTFEVDRLLLKHEKFLRVVHEIYADEDTRITFDEVQPLLVDAGLMGDGDLQLPQKDMAVAFSLSRLQVYDELRYNDRLTSLSFVDFLEFLARIADALSPPPRADLIEVGCTTGSLREYTEKARLNRVKTLPRRDSGGVAGTPTRYLHDKLELVVWMMIDTLCEKFKVPTNTPASEEMLLLELKRHKFAMNAKQAREAFRKARAVSVVPPRDRGCPPHGPAAAFTTNR